jgi:hypothetical protein
MQIFMNTPISSLPPLTTPASLPHEPVGATIRVVDESTSTSEAETCSSSMDTALSTPLTRDDSSSTLIHKPSRASSREHTPFCRPKSSRSFRGKDKSSPRTLPTRPRGKTLPAELNAHTPDRDRDRDNDSVLSFTPSVSSKHLANWFSGLLGR